jgi:hypothetical protein
LAELLRNGSEVEKRLVFILSTLLGLRTMPDDGSEHLFARCRAEQRNIDHAVCGRQI